MRKGGRSQRKYECLSIPVSIILLCVLAQVAGAALPTIGALPLPDLGPGTWGGYPGGLYPNSLNQRPSAIETAAIDIATNQIQPLDADGNPDPVNGKIVLISIGMSNTGQEFTKFISIANTDPSLNPKLVIVNGGIGGMDAPQWTDPQDPDTWDVLYTRLANAGVTRYQVQAVWVKQAKMNPAAEGAFPVHAQKLQGYIETIARNIKTNLPNAKIAYYSSRTRAFVLEGLNPEPYAYESSFRVKWMIQNQINGTGNLNWDSGQGTVVAPLILWGPYLWADGENPRSDGFVWLESDTQADGTHPSATGTEKVGRQLKAFFKTDPTARPWFLNHQYTGQPPTVSIIADKIAGAPGISVNFSANASDPDGSIVEYEWTYDDSLFSTDANPTKSFPVEGVYNVRLTVTDNQGNASTATKLITVSSDNPVASFTTDVDLGLAPLTVNFDASSSTDGNAPIVSYDWDFGDGNSDSGITTSHTYTIDGDYNAVLTVTAQNLLTGVAEKNIHVGPLDVNEMGDLYADQRIDFLDYAVLADYWLTGELTVDIVSDGIIDYKDLSAMADYWMFGVPIPTQGPVAYYMLDGNVNDSSGFGHDGTILGNPTWAAGFDETVNGALDFDGSGDVVNCGTFNPSGETGLLSIAMWVKWDGLVTELDQMVIAKRTAWSTDMMWQVTIKKDTGYIQIGSGNSPGGTSVADFGVSITSGAWTHLAITYDGTDATLYRNGANPIAAPFAIGLGTNATVSIGAAYQGTVPTNTGFAGTLDEVRLYDRPLSAAEIAALATAP